MITLKSIFYRFSAVIFVLIWSLLGFGEGNTPDLNRTAPLSSITNNSSRITLTEWFGYAIYGLYVFAAIVVLMNLLIAVMSNTFQEVQVYLKTNLTQSIFCISRFFFVCTTIDLLGH